MSAVCMAFVLTACGDRVEGDALETYLEVIDSLESGKVSTTTELSDNKMTVQFRPADSSTEILATVKGGGNETVIYYDRETLYTGTSQELNAYEGQALDPKEVKRSTIGAPSYAYDSEYYDAERSGIYKTLTGIKIVVVTHDEESDLYDVPDTILTMYLTKDMKPIKTEIVDEEGYGSKKSYKTVIKYSEIGEKQEFEQPVMG